MDLAVRIKHKREQLGLSKAALGRAVGVTGQAVSLWESGARDISIETLERIAAALRTSSVQLQGGNDASHINVDVLAACMECLDAAKALLSFELTTRQCAKVLGYLYLKGGTLPISEVVAVCQLMDRADG